MLLYVMRACSFICCSQIVAAPAQQEVLLYLRLSFEGFLVSCSWPLLWCRRV